MKKSNINILIPFLAFIILSLSSCLKGDQMNIDPKNPTGSIFELQYNPNGGTIIGSGLQYFGGAALTYPASHLSDTTSFNVNLAGPNAAAKDLTITVGADAGALQDNYSSDSITYEAMPDSLFHVLSTTATIKAGNRLANFQIVFYPSKIDPTKNYMLALTVTDAQGLPVSANFGHIYFHSIGNPLAGAYTWDYTRWNNGTGTGAPNAASFTGESIVFLPDNPTTVEVQSGYGDQNGFNVRYKISFKNNAGVLTDFKVVINPDDVKDNLTPNSITLLEDASVIELDAVNKQFKFGFKVANSAGDPRTLTDRYYK